MTGGELIELRLKQKLCIRCGLHAAIDSPYLCPGCHQSVERERKRKRDRDVEPWPRSGTTAPE